MIRFEEDASKKIYITNNSTHTRTRNETKKIPQTLSHRIR